MTGAFITELCMRDMHDDAGHFALLQDLVYLSAAGVRYVVPAGFVTDLNSSPRWAWFLYPKSNKANRAAVLHDWFYDTASVPKALADNLYREASACCGVNSILRWFAYQGVHRFGRGTWDQHTEARMAREGS